jgi:transcriptional regulator with XRE-family HTH domain
MDEAHSGQAVQAARGAMFEPWTQGRLAGEAGLSQSHLSKLERGENPMTVAMLAHLLRRMGVITFEVRVQSGEFLVDGRVVRPATFDKFGRRTARPSLETLVHG